MAYTNRLKDMKQLYDILNELKERIGMKTLAETLHTNDFPHTGMYFFFEPGESRCESGSGMRVVRVGISGEGGRHLVYRLRDHKSGNTEGSVFRRVIHKALENKYGVGSIEKNMVKSVIHAMPFLWLEVDRSDLRYLEINSIALLSNYNKPPLDPPSPNWLGRYSPNEKIRHSGLWNSDEVEKSYDPHFLDQLEGLVKKM